LTHLHLQNAKKQSHTTKKCIYIVCTALEVRGRQLVSKTTKEHTHPKNICCKRPPGSKDISFRRKTRFAKKNRLGKLPDLKMPKIL
jgi:hypothetical protein